MVHIAAALAFQTSAGTDWLSIFTENLTNLTTQNGGALTSLGLTELSFVSLMVLVNMVITWSTSTMTFGYHREPVRVGDLVQFLLRLICCLLAENYWSNPLPGASFGLNHLFSYLAQVIAQALDQNALSNLQQLLKTMGDGTAAPALTAPLELLAYVMIQGLLGLTSGVIFLINVSGFILYGVAALFGPVFIPLYMTRTFRGKFLRFVDTLLSLAMIRAVASAFIFVWGGFLNAFVLQTFQSDYSMKMWIANLIPCIALFLAFCINMLFVPSLTQMIFGGGAGAAEKIDALVSKVGDQRAEAGEFQTVAAAKHATGRSFTTPETIALERSTVASLKLGQDSAQPMMQDDAAREQANSRPQLNQGQRNAIQQILTSRDRVQGLQGLAGTGKTTTLFAIREGAERSGYAVEGFAPTSKASGQLREAGIDADTLQGFLARSSRAQTPGDPAIRHLYMLDESSLASTRQMRDFLDKIGPQDRVLVIGDTRQHQGVDAGKPFEQMQDAGMRTAQLDRIVRQRDPELLAAVEKLSKNETAAGIAMLQQQGRVQQIEDRQERIAAIAKDYAATPENTIIVSPDNASRRQINQAVRAELQEAGRVARDSHFLPTLIPRSELTGADRQWAAQYRQGDVVHYNTGSREMELARGSYATVSKVDPESNRLTVRREDGHQITYDPKRLHGVSTYQEIGRDFSKGDRIQFTAPSRELGVANRDLATIEKITDSLVTVRMDGSSARTVAFNPAKMRHFDHGYAVTSHSSQGVTAERVLVNMDTRAHPELINTRFAYVSVSRASHEAQIYTNDAAGLGQRLSRDSSKTSAIDFRQQNPKTEQRMANDAERGLQPESASREATRERIYTPAEHARHYAPLNRVLHAEDAASFGWKAENGTVQTYQHRGTYRHIHLDGPSGQFYDQQKNPITQQTALDHAMGPGNHRATQPLQEAVQQGHVDNSVEFAL